MKRKGEKDIPFSLFVNLHCIVIHTVDVGKLTLKIEIFQNYHPIGESNQLGLSLVKDLFCTWSQLPVKKNDRKLWLAAPLGICWAIWKERNIIMFEDAPFSHSWLKHSIISSLLFGAGIMPDVDITKGRRICTCLPLGVSFLEGRFAFCLCPFFFFCMGQWPPMVYSLETWGCFPGVFWVQ